VRQASALACEGSVSPLIRKKESTCFHSGYESVGDDDRAGALHSAVTAVIIRKVEDCILADRHVTVREVASELSLSIVSVSMIIHERLKF